MTNEQTIDEIMKSARARITSENATPVTVARMPAEEVAALLDEIERLKAQLAEPAESEPGELIEWAGGECPIPDGVGFQLKFCDDSQNNANVHYNATEWDWNDYAADADIVAYRVLP